MDTLRTELIETQKTRAEFMKWKLLIVAGIGGAALGFSGSSGPGPSNAYLALAIIPIACFYVDLICRHLSLRNKAIGMFIETHGIEDSVLQEYEKFYSQISQNVWNRRSLESMALVGCTVLLSIAIVPVGILASAPMPDWTPKDFPASLFYGAGATGLILSIWLQRAYQNAKRGVENLDCEN